MAHESPEPVPAGISALSQEAAKPGVVLVNHVGPFGQLRHPLARKRLTQPQGSFLAYSPRHCARNEECVVLDPGAPRRTVGLAGLLAALYHLFVISSACIPLTQPRVLRQRQRPRWPTAAAGATNGPGVLPRQRTARTRQAAVNHFVFDCHWV